MHKNNNLKFKLINKKFIIFAKLIKKRRSIVQILTMQKFSLHQKDEELDFKIEYCIQNNNFKRIIIIQYLHKKDIDFMLRKLKIQYIYYLKNLILLV